MTEQARARWYFDFVSPFAYLQFHRLKELPATLTLELRPVLFAGLLAHWGHLGPAELPTKRRFTYRHVQWLAERHGIPLRFPPAHPFNPLHALRLAVALDSPSSVVGTIFRFIWEEGRDITSACEWADLTRTLGIADAEAVIADRGAALALRRNGEEAIAGGVFGVPTLAIRGELFWGFDSTDMARDYLADPGRFAAEKYARLDALPVGAARDKSRL